VSIADTFGNPVASGYTRFGGYLDVTVQGAVEYVAAFTGTQAPQAPLPFVGQAQPGVPTTLYVGGYVSPSLSIVGYTQLGCRLLPRRRHSNAAKQLGGGIYATVSIFGIAVGTLDAQTEQLLGAERLWTCQGADLDSWALDFFGSWLPRYEGESDSIYRSRIIAAFGPRLTKEAVKQIVEQFYAATLLERIALASTELAFDEFGSYDTSGGYDVFVGSPLAQALTPVVDVWSAHTRPDLAAIYAIAAPQFVIQLGFTGVAGAWYLDRSFLDISTILTDGKTVQTSTTPPDPRLGALVTLVKASATQPIYQTYSD